MVRRAPLLAVLAALASPAISAPGTDRVALDSLGLAIEAWVTQATGMPVPASLPDFIFVEPASMPDLMSRRAGSTGAFDQSGIVTFYDSVSRVVYLPAGWTGTTPAELSILVHEMVHHAQTASGRRFACGAQREKEAYQAQARWLALFGTDLAREFDLDPIFLLVATSCGMP